MKELNFSELLYTAAEATFYAGQEVLRQYQEGFETIIKPDGSPLTTADLAANEILTERLSKTGIAVLSEEGEKFTHEFRQQNPYWCIDPIDGTRDFVDKTDEFCVSVGLIHENTSKIGILFAPALNLFYFAAESIGSYKFSGKMIEMKAFFESNEANLLEKAQKLPISIQPDKAIFMASRYHRSPMIDAYIEQLKEKNPELELVTIGSAIKLGLMAEGKANEYLRFTSFNFWDVAGGHAIVKYAGLPLKNVDSDFEVNYADEQMRIHGYRMRWSSRLRSMTGSSYDL